MRTFGHPMTAPVASLAASGLICKLIEGLLCALQIGSELRGAIVEPTADCIDEARPGQRIGFGRSRRSALARPWNLGWRARVLREGGDNEETRACGDRCAHREASSTDLW
jgi:hypothetical protein